MSIPPNRFPPTGPHAGRVINIDIQHFRGRVLQDALTEATAQYWIRRAQAFEDAAPRKGDHHGCASTDDLLNAYERCMATALACRRRAQLILDGRPEEIGPEVLAVLDEGMTSWTST